MTCAQPILAPIYLGRDNLLRLVLSHDNAVLADLSAVTRVVVTFDADNVIDSDTAGAGVIWWTDTASHRGQTVDVLSLQLGDQAIPAGVYDEVAIVIYDATYTNGLRIENAIKLTVHA